MGIAPSRPARGTTPGRIARRIAVAAAVLVTALALVVAPAAAGYDPVENPDLAIDGDNRFAAPGETITMTFYIRERGEFEGIGVPSVEFYSDPRNGVNFTNITQSKVTTHRWGNATTSVVYERVIVTVEVTMPADAERVKPVRVVAHSGNQTESASFSVLLDDETPLERFAGSDNVYQFQEVLRAIADFNDGGDLTFRDVLAAIESFNTESPVG